MVKKPQSSEEIKIRHSIQSKFLIEDNSLQYQDFQNLVIVSIKSGMAVTAFYENGQLTDHKVFRAYMVRKKQGKSQIKHLKTKGKSRAGSRVRLQETLEFFENINERLQSFFEENRVDLIALGCSPTLVPYFFNSKKATPFEKSDPRIFKIPIHVPSATFENMEKTYRTISQTKIWVDHNNEVLLRPYLAQVFPKLEEDSGEDW
ncbi:hypothetical protein [Cognataquiflexum nitidum]|uniref:hypothetical protein n=1 Tax=Cognataquiflexum nitidum TaxID=2922272 RepID=UPI001F139B63|nr:hypothetical protein [Cognataquiflexum nitidum]